VLDDSIGPREALVAFWVEMGLASVIGLVIRPKSSKQCEHSGLVTEALGAGLWPKPGLDIQPEWWLVYTQPAALTSPRALCIHHIRHEAIVHEIFLASDFGFLDLVGGGRRFRCPYGCYTGYDQVMRPQNTNYLAIDFEM
jgi:hypothetical protein